MAVEVNYLVTKIVVADFCASVYTLFQARAKKAKKICGNISKEIKNYGNIREKAGSH